jgi:transcriptional regulator with XRE-family HTH domain
MKSKTYDSITPEAQEAVKALGNRLRQARLRRNESQEMIAKRTGTTRTTQHRLESGNPGTALGVLVNTLFVLGLLDNLDDIANPDKDVVGRALEKNSLPKKAGRKTDEGFSSDF